MAIASVARQATVREDRSFRDAMQIVGQQQAQAKKLALEKEKMEQEKLKQKRAEDHKLMELYYKTGAPEYLAYNQEFQKMNKGVEDILLDPTVPYEKKQEAILGLKSYASLAESANTMFKDGIKARVEGDKDGFRIESGLTASTANFIRDPETGELKDISTLSRKEYEEYLDKDTNTYNYRNISTKFMDAIEEDVLSSLSVQNLSDDFAKETVTKKMSKLLKIENGEIQYDPDTGLPIANITAQNVNAFVKFNKGIAPELDRRVAEDEGIENRRDAMEAILRENGFLTVKEETELDSQRRPSDNSGGRGDALMNAADRAAWMYRQTFAEGADGQGMMDVITSNKYIVTDPVKRGEETAQTGVETDANGNKVFTVVVDNRAAEQLAPMMLDEEGNMSVDLNVMLGKNKEAKYTVHKVTLDKNKPENGIIKLHQLYNAIVPAKQKIDPVMFINAFNEVYKQEEAKKTQKPDPNSDWDMSGNAQTETETDETDWDMSGNN